jgi:hypothetical protein
VGIVVWLQAGGARGGSPPRYCSECRGAAIGAVLSGFCRPLIVTDAALAVFEPEAAAAGDEELAGGDAGRGSLVPPPPDYGIGRQAEKRSIARA